MNEIEKMKNRIAAILAQLEVYEGVETLTAEQVTEIKALETEFQDLNSQIEAKEKLAEMKAKATSTAGRKTAPAAGEVEVRASRKEKMGGFNSMGEFLQAVKKGDDKRFQNAMFERSGEEGGFLVPDEMMEEIVKKVGSDESLLSKTRQIFVSGNNLSLNLDENQPWSGGVTAYWTAEGAQITSSAHSFKQASWKLNKLAALVTATDELLEDAKALESYIKAMAPEAITHKINEAILVGNGVGKPTGILNSDFKIKVSKESGQAADTIVARNIVKMYNRMLPSSRANAVWYINPQCEDQLRLMKDDADNFIYLAAGSQMNPSPYATLMGRPVIPLLGGMKALGDEGDIIFADLSFYYSILKSSGAKSAVSTHLYFDKDQTAYKFTMRLDGKCPFKSPVSTQNGSYQMSAFVTLEDR